MALSLKSILLFFYKRYLSRLLQQPRCQLLNRTTTYRKHTVFSEHQDFEALGSVADTHFSVQNLVRLVRTTIENLVRFFNYTRSSFFVNHFFCPNCIFQLIILLHPYIIICQPLNSLTLPMTSEAIHRIPRTSFRH